MRSVAALAVLAVVCAGGAARAQEGYWSENKDFASDPDYAQSRALCRKVQDREPPAADRPNAVQAKALKGCRSEDLYYGIGMPADPAKARQCAFVESSDPNEGGVFSGDTMLMTIYANGRSAKRDLDLAMRYACGIGGAPAEYDGRVKHLAEMKAKPGGDPFDFCDDITSGLAGGYCASHGAAIDGAKRDARLKAMVAAWTPGERAAFAPLRKALAAYVDAHGSNEVDMSGALRGALEIDAEEEVKADFLAMLEKLSAGSAPRFPAAQAKAQDAKLNADYQKLQRAPDDGSMGTVTKGGIRIAQRAWLVYRDAFIAFAKVKFPAVPSDDVAAWMTQTRIKVMNGEVQ